MDDFTYILNTKLPNGVVHQHDAVLHSNPNVPVHPAAFLGPVLETFILLGGEGEETKNHNKEKQTGHLRRQRTQVQLGVAPGDARQAHQTCAKTGE